MIEEENDVLLDLEWTDADTEEENELLDIISKFKFMGKRVPKKRDHNLRKTRTRKAWDEKEQKIHQVKLVMFRWLLKIQQSSGNLDVQCPNAKKI